RAHEPPRPGPGPQPAGAGAHRRGGLPRASAGDPAPSVPGAHLLAGAQRRLGPGTAGPRRGRGRQLHGTAARRMSLALPGRSPLAARRTAGWAPAAVRSDGSRAQAPRFVLLSAAASLFL